MRTLRLSEMHHPGELIGRAARDPGNVPLIAYGPPARLKAHEPEWDTRRAYYTMEPISASVPTPAPAAP